MSEFSDKRPTLDNYWRSIILFGRNVASYKFALGKSVLELAQRGKEEVSLAELAEPFARNVCEHLRIADRQATSPGSRFLETCRQFNRGEIRPVQVLAARA